LVLLNKWDWLVLDCHVYVEHFQLHFLRYIDFLIGNDLAFFTSDGHSGWIHKSRKCKGSLQQRLSYLMKYDKCWPRPTFFNFDKPLKIKNLTFMSPHFSPYEQAVLLFAVTFSCDQTSYAFKCNDKHTPLVTDIRKWRVCYWNIKFKIKNHTTKSAELINSTRIGTIIC